MEKADIFITPGEGNVSDVTRRRWKQAVQAQLGFTHSLITCAEYVRCCIRLRHLAQTYYIHVLIHAFVLVMQTTLIASSGSRAIRLP